MNGNAQRSCWYGIAWALLLVMGPIRLAAADQNVQGSRATLQTYVEGGDFSFIGKDTRTVLEELPYDSISLERTACYGSCPVYVVTFFKDGKAVLEEKDLRDNRRTRYVGEMWIGEYVRLTQMVELARRSAQQTKYAGRWTDDYTAIVRATSKGETWSVSDYGRVAPVEVWALETLLHNFKEQGKWKPAAPR
ncbi:DUF6438 domain-containing protein [Roseateles sp. P5_D6]